jgi:putative ABC transport system permease protein
MSERAGWARLYRTLLRLLPARLRASRGQELAEVFDQLTRDARQVGGRRAASARAARECLDLVMLATRSRLAALAWRNGDLAGDVRVAARALRHRPAFAFSAAATLSVGIGAATAVFAVADTLLIRPLPFPDSDRLVMLWRVVERFDMRRAPISLPNFIDWRDDVSEFTSAAAWSPSGPTLVGAGDPVRLRAYRVTGDFFRTLGVSVVSGRPLLPEDDRPGAEPVAVLSHALWTARFGADPAVVGRTLELNGVSVRVVGVAPPDFAFPARDADIWVPLAIDPVSADRDLNFLTPVARLSPEVSTAAAEQAFRAAQARVAEAFPNGNEVDDVWLEPLRQYQIGDAAPAVLLLVGAVGLLLAIACANLTALLLVRAASLGRELAVRSALGGSPGRIARTFLAEASVLALAGGALGAVVAAGLLRGLAVIAPPELLRRGAPSVDARVLVFCAAISTACALACAFLPARAAARHAPAQALREGAAGSRGRRSRLHDALVVGQVALATVLLVGAGLLGSSLKRLLDQPVGFDSEGVLTLQLNLPRNRYPTAVEAGRFHDALLERLRAHPGVAAVGATWSLPFTPTYAGSTARAEDATDQEPVGVAVVPVRGDYFEAMGMQLVEGRMFGPEDRADAPPVAIISRSLADAFWPGVSPIGKRVADDEPITVIGVAADVRSRSLDADPQLDMYLPHSQTAWASHDLYFTLRARDGDPEALIATAREAVADLDPALPREGLMPLARRVSSSAAEPRSRSLLVGGFAAAAALLSAIGVYGVLAYRVAQRRPEVALRVALGASRRSVLGRVLARALALGSVGLSLGFAAASLGMPALGAFLFEVSPLEPGVYAAVATLVTAAAAAAGWLPARRAARVDPMSTLRGE